MKKYPELESIVDVIVDNACNLINQLTRDVKSEMPYKQQWVLEEVARMLQGRV
jgi:hypothetical protein